MNWNHKMTVWPYLEWKSESNSVFSIVNLIQPTRREWVMIIIISVLSFSTIVYRNLALENANQASIVVQQASGVIVAVQDFTTKVEKLNYLTTSMIKDDIVKINLQQHADDITDLISQMNVKIDLSVQYGREQK